jgi:hypothetical protein
MGMLRLFSSSLARDAALKAEHEAAELDELERNKSRSTRYLVSWLPWLSLLKHWRNEMPEHKEKDLPTTVVKRVTLTDKPHTENPEEKSELLKK